MQKEEEKEASSQKEPPQRKEGLINEVEHKSHTPLFYGAVQGQPSYQAYRGGGLRQHMGDTCLSSYLLPLLLLLLLLPGLEKEEGTSGRGNVEGRQVLCLSTGEWEELRLAH